MCKPGCPACEPWWRHPEVPCYGAVRKADRWHHKHDRPKCRKCREWELAQAGAAVAAPLALPAPPGLEAEGSGGNEDMGSDEDGMDLDALAQRLGVLERDYHTLVETVRDLNRAVRRLTDRVERLEEETPSTRTTVCDLQDRHGIAACTDSINQGWWPCSWQECATRGLDRACVICAAEHCVNENNVW